MGGSCNPTFGSKSKREVPKISSGDPSTLKTYRRIALALTGSEESEAVKFFDKKIKESLNGEDEVVIQAESQVMFLIGSMMRDKK
jgi:hypothetical protein